MLQGCSAWSLELSCETGWKTGLAGQAGFSSELTGLSLSSSFLSIRDCTSSFRIYHLGGAKKATRVNSFEFTLVAERGASLGGVKAVDQGALG